MDSGRINAAQKARHDLKAVLAKVRNALK